ncbi:MAG TPA: MFS transporter [Chloroflexota bacterium]|jgi:EmrB/QacA subfamily drug resistance transporter
MQLTRKAIATLAAVSMVAMLSALDQTVVSTALPHILESLPGAALLGWVFTAYFVGATATVAVVGKLADLFGRRTIFLLSVGLFSTGSLLCGLAVTLPLLVGFRGLQGVGAGAIQTCSLIVMSDMFPPRERARWQVINSIGFATASAIGPTVGGFLADNFSWRWIFLLNVPLCLATVGALLYGLSGQSRSTSRPRIDWAGVTWSTLMIVAVLLVCTWGGREFEWTSPTILGLIGLALVSLFMLVRAERAAPDPVIPGNLLHGATRIYSLIASSANSMVWFGLILLVPLRLQLVLGASATQAGALLTPGIVLGPLGSVAAGQIMARTGRYGVTAWFAGGLQFVGAATLLLMSPTADAGWVVAAYLLAAIGTGFGGPTFMIAYQNDLRRNQLGAGVGFFSLCRQFGSSVSTAVAGAIVGTGVSEAGLGEAVAGVVQQAFVLPALAGVAVLAAAVLIPKMPLRTTQRESEAASRQSLVASR